MALGIYKPGQGYWVRVLTATGLGIVTLATAGWLWGQMGVLADQLPKVAWQMQGTTVQEGAPAAGQRVSLESGGENGEPFKEIGTAEIASFESASGQLMLRSVQMNEPTMDAGMARRVIGTAGGPALRMTPKPNETRGEPAIKPAVLQGLVVAAVIVLGFVLAYWLTAMHQKFVEFLIATDMEMKKVNWSTRRDIIKSTMVVVLAAFLIAGSLFVVDLSFQALFRAAGVLTY